MHEFCTSFVQYVQYPAMTTKPDGIFNIQFWKANSHADPSRELPAREQLAGIGLLTQILPDEKSDCVSSIG